MNITLYDTVDKVYYLASVRKIIGSDKLFLIPREYTGDFGVVTKKVSLDGHLLTTGRDFTFETQCEAEKKVRAVIKIKMQRRGWVPVDLEKLPNCVMRFLEVPPEMQVSPEEMVMILREAQVERYVVFGDVAGLEEYYDAGIEYLGYQTKDENIIKVFDKFGTPRDCFTHRIKEVELTERAIEAKAKAVRDMKLKADL